MDPTNIRLRTKLSKIRIKVAPELIKAMQTLPKETDSKPSDDREALEIEKPTKRARYLDAEIKNDSDIVQQSHKGA